MNVFIGTCSSARACGTTIFFAVLFIAGFNQRKSPVATSAPPNWAAMKAGASTGRIPANVFDTARANVTAGFANDVEAVNQYAAVMYAPTAKGTTADRDREQPQITANRPKVATNSLNTWALPRRA